MCESIEMSNCWNTADPLMVAYHDEWGTPVHDDRVLFEFLCLEGMQAGLSWRQILNRRQNFRDAFNNFEPKLVAAYTEKDVIRLLSDPGIIRNKRKIESIMQEDLSKYSASTEVSMHIFGLLSKKNH
jgi:DNA-3-methyladenine glycosylase I